MRKAAAAGLGLVLVEVLVLVERTHNSDIVVAPRRTRAPIGRVAARSG
jgi:hypothetical protein